MRKADLKVERQCTLPVVYDSIKLDAGYRVDILVEDSIILELKSVEQITPTHKAQLMTHFKALEIKVRFTTKIQRQEHTKWN